MNQETNFESRRNNARNFGGGVYIGGVIAATALFISFVLTAFPPDAYLSRVIMSVAGLAVGCSMLAFPYALHNWVVEKKHRTITTVLYYIEMVFIGVNTIVSFVTLLAKVTGYDAPEWAVLYEPFSILSIIYVIFAWGTIFNFDPQSVTEHKQREYDETRKKLIAETKLDYLKSQEGRMDIATAAQAEIEAEARNRQPRSFFENQPQSPALADQLFNSQKKEQAVPFLSRLSNIISNQQPPTQQAHGNRDSKVAWIDMPDGNRKKLFCMDCKAAGRANWHSEEPCEHVLEANSYPVDLKTLQRILQEATENDQD